MSEGTIVFVHGTGTRLADYQPAFRNVAAKLKQYRLDYELVSCEWGDALGARFDGLSLPDLAVQELDDNDVQWYYLFDDPFHNLRPYTIRGSTNSADSSAPGTMPRGLRVWTTVSQYRPSPEFLELLKVSDLLEFWPQAWSFIIKESDIPSRAYSESGNESPDVSYELARSLVAELSNLGRQAGYCGPGHKLRDQMVDRLIVDWGENVFGLGNLLSVFLKQAATPLMKRYRRNWSEGVAFKIGDILLYQANGEKIRNFIKERVDAASAKPVFLLAHSLGGIACVDLLAMFDLPEVAGLITFGSQAPLLYELGAMRFTKEMRDLPTSFPPWLNLYDRNDFLSYVAHRLFPSATDFEVVSKRPFPDSHGSYLEQDPAWESIVNFLGKSLRKLSQ